MTQRSAVVGQTIATDERTHGCEQTARTLIQVTAGWNVAEGIVAVTSGVIAGSVALVGFGLDSFIELAAALALLWRLNLHSDDPRVEARELLARRIVGATFIALALFISAEVVYAVRSGHEPEASTVGITLAVLSLAVMPVIGLMKRGNAKRLGSSALLAESTETLVCSYLSFTLFIGLAANALFGWWWADLVAALAMVPWIVKEGVENLRGDTCGDDHCD
jgi:divalent metal cation (Fe/Co/Zn/Cd) transporter